MNSRSATCIAHLGIVTTMPNANLDGNSLVVFMTYIHHTTIVSKPHSRQQHDLYISINVKVIRAE